MKIKNIFISLTVASLSLVSCNDWFDVSPATNMKESDLLENEQGFQDILIGVYQLMATDNLFGRELTYGFNDVRAQYWEKITSTTHHYHKAANFNYTDAAEVIRIDKIWNTAYKAISNTNAILASIDGKRTIFSSGNYELCKGETLTARALLHFEILRMFAPTPTDGLDVKAIPYFDSYTNVPQKQLTIKECCDKIRKDLVSAREILADYDIFGVNYNNLYSETNNKLSSRRIRLNYWAATALLARLELYVGNKTEALKAAKEIIDEPASDPKMPISYVTSPSTSDKLFYNELIFAIDYQKIKDVNEKFFNELNTGMLLSTSDTNRDKIYASAGVNDAEKRKSVWFKVGGTSASTLLKYEDMKLIPIIRLSEMYYIAAESASTPEIGLQYLNKIRAIRGLAPLDNPTQLATQIKLEYHKEFIGEGQVFHYYKRLGLKSIGVSKTKNITSTYKEVYGLPLPKSEIEFGRIE